MDNIFYYYTLIFLFRCIRGMWFSDKFSKKTFETINSISPLTNLNPEDKKKDSNFMLEKIKKKGLGAFFNMLDIIWVITGLSMATQWYPFLLLLITFLISTYGVFFLKSASQIRVHYNALNIIDIFICSCILYQHFFTAV